jgi:Ca-activated chloride channel family protein
MFKGLEFANPEYFYLFILVPLLLVWYILREKKQYATLNISTMEQFRKAPVSFRTRMRHSLILLRMIALSFLIIALARPQTSSSRETINTEGIDIILSIDVSESMEAEDLKPNRLEAAKKTAGEFIAKRPNDRIGLVQFAAESFTQCPITIDHKVLGNLMQQLRTGVLESGTAIGDGLATAVNRIKDTDGKSKVIILLTDGKNNRGNISPQTAAELARTFDIRVYTIGVGTTGQAPITIDTPFGKRKQMMDVEIDEELLTNIAEITGGKYFRAKNNKGLKAVYEEIDSMEKNKIDVAVFSKKTEKFFWFVMIAGFAVILEMMLRYTVFRSISN